MEYVQSHDLFPHLVFDWCNVSLGHPVHSSGEVSDRGRSEELPRLPIWIPAVTIIHLGELSTILQGVHAYNAINQPTNAALELCCD